MIKLTRLPTTLVFDCGDTLLELSPPKEIICQEVLAAEGLVVEPELLQRAYLVVEHMFKQHASRETTPKSKQQFFDRYNQELCDILGLRNMGEILNRKLQQAFRSRCRWEADSATRHWLEWASDRFDCYVFANWSSGLRQELEQAELAHFFNGIYSSEEIGFEKPDPRSFGRFLEVSGLQADNCIYIGNEYRADCIGSRALGFEPVLLDRHGRYPACVDAVRISNWEQLRLTLTSLAAD